MAQWRCPGCRRKFGRANQSHVCAPAVTLEQYLKSQPPALRSTYRAVLKALSKLGPLDVDPVGVGIMVKRARTFCELRPRKDGVELSFKLSQPLSDARIRKSLRSSTHRRAYFLDLRSPQDVDRQLLDWLALSYRESPVG